MVDEDKGERVDYDDAYLLAQVGFDEDLVLEKFLVIDKKKMRCLSRDFMRCCGEMRGLIVEICY